MFYLILLVGESSKLSVDMSISYVHDSFLYCQVNIYIPFCKQKNLIYRLILENHYIILTTNAIPTELSHVPELSPSVQV